jgi:glycosyltransferase involved in cell wall biosynthesis
MDGSSMGIMNQRGGANGKPIRVLYSFPLKLGAERICYTAWQQVNGLSAAGAEVTVFSAAISRPLPANVKVRPTLARGKIRFPSRLLGRMAYARLHDWLVSRRIEKMAGQIDIIHTWPVGALRTLKTAAKLGIPTVLERCNAHTCFAYEVVQKECKRLGIAMPPGHEHAFNASILARESKEYDLANKLLCPSDFVARTFRERGFPDAKLARHQYGYDDKLYYPAAVPHTTNGGLTFLFAGGCAPRKGLHHALNAWSQSSASKDGTFLIAGTFIPGYAEVLSQQLAHPRVKVMGHRNDLPELMRQSDVLVLPSLEEGSALVTYEARGSGCVLLVSDAAGAVCKHMENALVHPAGDVAELAKHISMLHEDRNLFFKLRETSLSGIRDITWNAAGQKLLQVYREVVDLT